MGSSSREHLEKVLHTFIDGYNLAVGESAMPQLAKRLDASFSPEFVGFAYEGAGLYFGLIDLLLPGSKRLAAFARSAGKLHDYITVVGAGFAVARIPGALRRLESYQKTLDPMCAWCLADGYGFHEGFFHWKRFVDGRRQAPASLTLQNRRLFDSGVGRAMWWVYGADPAAIAAGIGRFDRERQPEMWSGIGTALAYASGGPSGAAPALLSLAGEYRYDLLSGIPFAAHMRQKGAHHAAWTDIVCSELLHLTVAQTSALIAGEVDAYLASWQGSEEDKWKECYLAVREQVKQRLVEMSSKAPDRAAAMSGSGLLPDPARP